MDHMGDIAAHPFSLAVVAVASAVNAALGAGAMLAAEVNDGVLAGMALFVLGTGTGIIGWALVLLVRLSNVVARLESTAEDHERRLGRMES